MLPRPASGQLAQDDTGRDALTQSTVLQAGTNTVFSFLLRENSSALAFGESRISQSPTASRIPTQVEGPISEAPVQGLEVQPLLASETDSESRPLTPIRRPRTRRNDSQDEGRSRSGRGEDADTEQMRDELRTIVFKLQNFLPFVLIFLCHFYYQHAKAPLRNVVYIGISMAIMATAALSWLDQRFKGQVALKENASLRSLVVIVFFCVVYCSCLYLIEQSSPWYSWYSLTFDSSEDSVSLWDVLWVVGTNDFMLRVASIAVKATVTLLNFDHRKGVCLVQRPQTDASAVRRPAAPQHRKNRRMYAFIEYSSIFLRTLVSTGPWYRFYLGSNSAKFAGSFFSSFYLIMKGLVLGNQARRLFTVAKVVGKSGLEYGKYVTTSEFAEAGSPDCSICYERMTQPVSFPCDHMFCEDCVSEWLERERTCPLCRADVVPEADKSLKLQYLDGGTSLFPQML